MFLDALAINSIISVLILLLILYLDRYEKEPLSKIAQLLFGSIIITALFAFLKQKLIGALRFSPLIESYVMAGFWEESFKFLILFYVLRRWKCINESFDIIVYISVIATAFSLFENIEYVTSYVEYSRKNLLIFHDSASYPLAFSQILGARVLPGHLLFDISAVFLITRSREKGYFIFYFCAGLFVAILLHGTWNFLSLLNEIWFVVYLFLLTILAVLSIVYALITSTFKKEQERHHILIDRNIFLLKALTVKADSPEEQHKTELIRRLVEVQKLISKLPFLRGENQRKLFQTFNEHFPSPVNQFAYEGPSGSLERLNEIRRILNSYRDLSINWSYYVGVFLLLLLSAFTALLVSYALLQKI